MSIEASDQPIKSHVTINDLSIVNFKTPSATADINQWKDTHTVFSAMSCMRQIWVGQTNDFKDFPYGNMLKNKQIQHMQGSEAYKFLLGMLNGLDTPKEGEKNLKGQFIDAWQKFEAAHPAEAVPLRGVIQDLIADSRVINSEITVGIKPQKHERAATSLAGVKGGEKILILGSLSARDEASILTLALVRAFANPQKKAASEIIVAHHDPKAIEALNKQFTFMFEKEKSLKMPIKVVSYDELQTLMETADQVYSDITMNQNPEVDNAIISAWKGHSRGDNKLIMLKGEPANRGLSTTLWNEAGLNNYISPEDIRDEMSHRAVNNKRLEKLSVEAAEFCAQMRLEGKRPTANAIRDFAGSKDGSMSAPAEPIFVAPVPVKGNDAGQFAFAAAAVPNRAYLSIVTAQDTGLDEISPS